MDIDLSLVKAKYPWEKFFYVKTTYFVSQKYVVCVYLSKSVGAINITSRIVQPKTEQKDAQSRGGIST